MTARFRHFSIQRKLMAMSLGATGTALVLAVLAFMCYDFITYRSALVRRLSSLADIISLNTVSAVTFNDPAAASKILESLQIRQAMRSAVIYTSRGDVFASWERPGEPPLTLPPSAAAGHKAHVFSTNHLAVFSPVVLDQNSIGTVALVSDLGELRTRLKLYVLIALCVMLFSFAVAAFIAFKVGQRISQPILQLTETAARFAHTKDYSLRVAEGNPDELGGFIRTFNGMLGKIQQDEAALSHAHAELEKRVEERTIELTAANQELEAFSYSVSHDLRSPLRAIDGFSRELLENASENLDDQAKSDLQRIRKATIRMSELIDSLLKLSRLTRMEMTREVVDLSALVEKIVQDLKTAYPARQVDTRIAPEISAFGNTQLLLAALENLIGNAWKFTEKRSPGKIEFGRFANDKGKNVFFVRDNGAGFNMAYASKLFGVFQRLHDSKDYPGTGVGLATVQRIIHRHGGKIWAEAEVDRGATFYFTLA